MQSNFGRSVRPARASIWKTSVLAHLGIQETPQIVKKNIIIRINPKYVEENNVGTSLLETVPFNIPTEDKI